MFFHICKVLFALLLMGSPLVASPLAVHVSIPPQVYLAERLGGERVQVRVFVPVGESCETFQPRPAHVRELAGSRLFFSIGVAYEASLLPRIAANFPTLRVVDTTKALRLREGDACCGDPLHGHGHDPHVWMCPDLAVGQAAHMLAALIEADPDGRVSYEDNFARLVTDLAELRAELGDLLHPYAGRAVFVYHPAFGYFTDAFGLRQVAIEDHGREPSPRRIAQLIAEAREAGARVVFVQPAEASRAAELIAEAIRGRVVVLDPMRADWSANMREIAGAIADSFRDDFTAGL